VAEPEGCHQASEVRTNQREEDGDAHRRTLQRIPMYVALRSGSYRPENLKLNSLQSLQVNKTKKKTLI